MKVHDVMTRDVITVGRGSSFKEIAEKLVRHDISAVPVVDGQNRLLGIVSEADLMPREAAPRRRSLRTAMGRLMGRTADGFPRVTGLFAQGIMTPKVVTAAPDEDIRTVARRMLDADLKRLPVIEAGRVVGLVARADLMRIFTRSDASIRTSIEGLLRRCLYAPPDHEIEVAVFDGVVRLSGSVLHESDVRVAGAIVAAADGVIDVDNHLVGREPDPRPRDVRRTDTYVRPG